MGSRSVHRAPRRSRKHRHPSRVPREALSVGRSLLVETNRKQREAMIRQLALHEGLRLKPYKNAPQGRSRSDMGGTSTRVASLRQRPR